MSDGINVLSLFDGRGSGKTTKLAFFSNAFKIPIVTSTQGQVNYIVKYAEEHGWQIPKPVTIEQMRNGRHIGQHIYDNVFVDDAYTSGLLENALNQYLQANVKVCVIDKSRS